MVVAVRDWHILESAQNSRQSGETAEWKNFLSLAPQIDLLELSDIAVVRQVPCNQQEAFGGGWRTGMISIPNLD